MPQYQKISLLNLILCSSAALFSTASKSCYVKGMAGKKPNKVCDIRDFFKTVRDYNKDKFMKTPNAHIFSGPHGIGKYSTALAMAYEMNAKIVIVTVEDLSDPNKNTMEFIAQVYKDADEYVSKNNRPVVIIFKDIEVVNEIDPKLQSKYWYIIDALKIATQDRLGNPCVTTIITTSDWSKLDDSLISRLMPVSFSLPDKNDRLHILQYVTKKHRIQLPSYLIKAMAFSSHGKKYRDFDQALGKYAFENDHTLAWRDQMKLFHSLAKQNYAIAGAIVVTSLAATLCLIYGAKYLPKINFIQGIHREN